MVDAVRSAYASKPDPDEPWRYVSPCCRRQVFRTETGHRFRCGGCGTHHDRADLEDLKV